MKHYFSGVLSVNVVTKINRVTKDHEKVTNGHVCSEVHMFSKMKIPLKKQYHNINLFIILNLEIHVRTT